MEKFDKIDYLIYYAESIMSDYEQKEYIDERKHRIAREQQTYVDFINAATNPNYSLRDASYTNIIYMMEMAREMRMDGKIQVWLKKLLNNKEFFNRVQVLIVNIEKQRLKDLAQDPEAKKEINWDRYINKGTKEELERINNGSIQTQVYNETRQAENYIKGYIGTGYDWKVKLKTEEIEEIKKQIINSILDENGQIRETIKLSPTDKEKLPLYIFFLRSIGRLCDVDESKEEIKITTHSVLEKEIDIADLEI